MNILWTNRNFLILFLGRTITNIGDSLCYVAAMWLVYQLGGSSFYTGIAGFLILLPMSLQFLTGPFVDRWPIKRTLVITQMLQFLLILLIPIAYSLGFLSVHMVLIVIPLAALIEQFTNPSEKKALPLILDKAALVKGDALFSFAYQGIDMIFNAVGGVLVAAMGAIALYTVDSITFALTAGLFGLLALPAARKPSAEVPKKPRMKISTYVHELKEGFSIVLHSLLAVSLVGTIICNFALGASMAVLPALADVKGGAQLYGYLLAAEATGMLIGSLFAAWVGRFRVGVFGIISFAMGAGFWLLAAVLPWSDVNIMLYGLAWVPIGASNVLFAAVQQSVIPNRVYARVGSVQYSLSAAAMPLGSLLGGAFSSVLGSVFIFAIAGAGLFVIPLVWLLHPQMRRLPAAKEMKPATFNLGFAEEEKGWKDAEKL